MEQSHSGILKKKTLNHSNQLKNLEPEVKNKTSNLTRENHSPRHEVKSILNHQKQNMHDGKHHNETGHLPRSSKLPVETLDQTLIKASENLLPSSRKNSSIMHAPEPLNEEMDKKDWISISDSESKFDDKMNQDENDLKTNPNENLSSKRPKSNESPKRESKSTQVEFKCEHKTTQTENHVNMENQVVQTHQKTILNHGRKNYQNELACNQSPTSYLRKDSIDDQTIKENHNRKTNAMVTSVSFDKNTRCKEHVDGNLSNIDKTPEFGQKCHPCIQSSRRKMWRF